MFARNPSTDGPSNAQDSDRAEEAAKGAGEKTEFPTSAQAEMKAGYPPAVETFGLCARSRSLGFGHLVFRPEGLVFSFRLTGTFGGLGS